MATNQNKGTRSGDSQGGSSEQHRQAGQQSHKNTGSGNQSQQNQRDDDNQRGGQGQGGHRWSPEEAREQGKKGGQSRSNDNN